jgi:hypothetical protein
MKRKEPDSLSQAMGAPGPNSGGRTWPLLRPAASRGAPDDPLVPVAEVNRGIGMNSVGDSHAGILRCDQFEERRSTRSGCVPARSGWAALPASGP